MALRSKSKMSPEAVPHTVVIGGSAGTGAAVVRYFAQQGHRLSVVARRPRPRDLPGAYFRADLTEVGKIPALLARVVGRSGPWSNLVFVQRHRGGGDAWQRQWELVVKATGIFIEAATAPGPKGGQPMAQRSIVLFGSVVGRFVAPNQDGAYHAVQGAVRQLARYYAVRLGPEGVRVNSISLATLLKKPLEESTPEARTRYAALARRIPLRRVGDAAEIAAAAFLLCQPGASYITGHDLVVDGGLSALAQEGLIDGLG